MTQPNFFVVGAAKSGTTSLYQYLIQHPQIAMPSLKEPHFFGEYRPSGRKIENMDAYLGLFKGFEEFRAVGEASTAYLYSPSAPEEIKAAFPDAKIIIVLRNPVDRAYSLYWNHIRDCAEDLTFEGALDAESARMKAGWAYGFHYVQSGMYSAQVNRYLKTFGRDKIKVFLFEELKNDPSRLLKECASFLGVEEDFQFHSSKIFNKSGPPRNKMVSRFLHSSSTVKRVILSLVPRKVKDTLKIKLRDMNVDKVPPMCIAVRNQLIDRFQDDVRSLEKLIDRDLSHWTRKQ